MKVFSKRNMPAKVSTPRMPSGWADPSYTISDTGTSVIRAVLIAQITLQKS
jgi:hypothetical protein